MNSNLICKHNKTNYLPNFKHISLNISCRRFMKTNVKLNKKIAVTWGGKARCLGWIWCHSSSKPIFTDSNKKQHKERTVVGKAVTTNSSSVNQEFKYRSTSQKKKKKKHHTRKLRRNKMRLRSLLRFFKIWSSSSIV